MDNYLHNSSQSTVTLLDLEKAHNNTYKTFTVI